MALLLQSLVLLVAGMSIVFLFLSLMVWVMSLSAPLVAKFNHILPDDKPRQKSRGGAGNAAAQDQGELVAVALAVARARAMRL